MNIINNIASKGQFSELFNKSEDALIVLQNDRIIQSNVAAASLLPEIEIIPGHMFSLSALSPEYQSDGQLSVKVERNLFDTALKTGFARYSWTFNDKKTNSYYYEITVLVSSSMEVLEYWLFFREINEEVGIRKKLIQYQIELDKKIKQIHSQNEKIELQGEHIETQRDVALKQRDEISIQKRSITDSIKYASRIQTALLPHEAAFSDCFRDFFILYNPKDIVSGDFFWITKNKNKIIVAAADCTGHGVPGALMSIMGIAFLDEIVKGRGIVEPDLILNLLRQRIITSLGQKGDLGETSNGMDIALCTIDYDNMKLQFSGAFNPLILIRKNTLKEIKGDKMPLSYYMGSDPSFTMHEIDILPKDSIYIFSDGYADQFGWRENKKFNVRRFKELLLSIQGLPLNSQKVLLENEFNNWKGDVEQIDDILILGFQV